MAASEGVMATGNPYPFCTCIWIDQRMEQRDKDCPRHGDGSDWWAGVRARGERLREARFD